MFAVSWVTCGLDLSVQGVQTGLTSFVLLALIGDEGLISEKGTKICGHQRQTFWKPERGMT